MDSGFHFVGGKGDVWTLEFHRHIKIMEGKSWDQTLLSTAWANQQIVLTVLLQNTLFRELQIMTEDVSGCES